MMGRRGGAVKQDRSQGLPSRREGSGKKIWTRQEIAKQARINGKLNSIVFVSSADWDLTTGIAAADALCNDLAEASGLDTTNGFYLAWLSDSTTSPSQRFFPSPDPYVRPDNTIIASNYTDLVDGSLTNPIIQTEQGLTNTIAFPWTGTFPDGTVGPAHCLDWTTDAPNAEMGTAGWSGTIGTAWTDLGAASCSASRGVYCFQQLGHADPRIPPTSAPPPDQIPTLGSSGIVLLIAMLVISGILVLRRRQAAD